MNTFHMEDEEKETKHKKKRTATMKDRKKNWWNKKKRSKQRRFGYCRWTHAIAEIAKDKIRGSKESVEKKMQ